MEEQRGESGSMPGDERPQREPRRDDPSPRPTKGQSSPGAPAAELRSAVRLLPALLRRRGLPTQDAEDVAQGMLCELLEEIRKVPGSIRSPLGVLIYRIPYAVTAWRRRRTRTHEVLAKEKDLESLEGSGRPVLGTGKDPGEVTEVSVRAFLSETWPTLATHEVDLLMWRCFHGLSAAKTAAVLGWSRAKVKRAYARIGRTLHFSGPYQPP